MKITKEQLLKIVKEELLNINDEEATIDSLEPLVKKALEKLDVEEQSVVLQYINLLRRK